MEITVFDLEKECNVTICPLGTMIVVRDNGREIFFEVRMEHLGEDGYCVVYETDSLEKAVRIRRGYRNWIAQLHNSSFNTSEQIELIHVLKKQRRRLHRSPISRFKLIHCKSSAFSCI